ncbi:MAG: type II secretion system protein [Alphaproteobacteria bacterium]|nr:type II secretion system protein [Alphaproteobacteria bacterium]
MSAQTKLKNSNTSEKIAERYKQYGRLLSPCAEDAPQVSNDVYNQRYTREKLASRYKQSGRSMIEMLGVLAIIGVLTVGSITGYSKAMRRHLLNKQREQYSYILSAIETHIDTLDIFNLPSAPTKGFITLGWIPEEMIKDDSDYIYDIFKNKISFYRYNTPYSYFGIRTGLTNNHPYEQCVNLYQTFQLYHSSAYQTSIIYDNKRYANIYNGDRYCNGRNEPCIRDLTPAEISSMCHACDNTYICGLYFSWRK